MKFSRNYNFRTFNLRKPQQFWYRRTFNICSLFKNRQSNVGEGIATLLKNELNPRFFWKILTTDAEQLHCRKASCRTPLNSYFYCSRLMFQTAERQRQGHFWNIPEKKIFGRHLLFAQLVPIKKVIFSQFEVAVVALRKV